MDFPHYLFIPQLIDRYIIKTTFYINVKGGNLFLVFNFSKKTKPANHDVKFESFQKLKLPSVIGVSCAHGKSNFYFTFNESLREKKTKLKLIINVYFESVIKPIIMFSKTL